MNRVTGICIVLGLVGLLLFIGYSSYGTILKFNSETAVLKFDRASTWTAAMCDVDVFVNGIKIGSVGSGTMKEFRFRPSGSGTNQIMARLIAKIGPNLDSNEVQFRATPQAIVYARYEIDPYVAKFIANTKLAVAIEKEGVAQDTVLGVGQRRIDAHTANGQPTELPWDAIGAIAGVLGVLVAMVTFFMRKA